MASDNDEWTLVPSKKRNNTKNGPQNPAAMAPEYSHDDRPPPIDTTMTLEQIRTDYRRQLRLWRQSQARVALLKVLTFLRPDEGWGIRKAVLIGTGSYNREGDAIMKKRLMQLGIWMDLIECLEKDRREDAESEKIKCYAQEPAYTDMDHEFLTELGVKVVDFGAAAFKETIGLGPAADLFGPETFVCEFFIFYHGLTARPFVQGGNKLMISTIRYHLIDEPFYKPTFGHMIEGLLEELDKKYRNYHFPAWKEQGLLYNGLDVFGPQPSHEDEGEEAENGAGGD